MNPITKFIRRHPMATFWGIAWSTSFLGFFMNERNPEGLWGFLLYGPFVGGILVTAIADGSSGLKTYFSRLVRWRVGIQWYVAALFIPPVLRLAAFGLNIISGAAAPTSIQWPAWIDVFFEAFLLISLAEEPGFRGFALPRLMEGRSALSASLSGRELGREREPIVRAVVAEQPLAAK